MSNSLAIAMVTATLERLLRNAIEESFGATFTVTTDRPRRNGEDPPAGDIAGSQAAVNIFLYQVNPNGAWRNRDLPTRGAGGQLLQRPVAAVDLHYIFTFYGDESLLEPQRLLGITLSTLHATPVLSREMIAATRQLLPGGPLAMLAASDLDEQIDLVRLTPHCFDLDQMSKLWSIFSQNAYALSVAYLASVVLIEAAQTPQAPLPVREGRVYVTAFKQPAIETVRAESGGPITAGSRIILTGSNLQADPVRVRIGGVEVEPLAVSGEQIVLAAPLLNVQAGVQGISVAHPLLLGEPPAQRPGAESNTLAFTLSPLVVGSTVAGSTLTVRLLPAAGRRQRVRLLLVRPDLSLTYELEPDASAAAGAAQETLDFNVASVEAGAYLVRLQVDGAQSPLTAGANGEFIGPSVTI